MSLVTDYTVCKPVDSQTINATAAYTSGWFNCAGYKEFGFWAKAASAGGTADIKLQCELHPLTSAYASGDPTKVVDVDATSTPTETYIQYTDTTVNGVVANKFRIIVTGVASNPADTVANVYVSLRA